MDPIKEAFFRIKQDIFALKAEIAQMRELIKQLQHSTNPTNNATIPLSTTDKQTEIQTIKRKNNSLESLYNHNLAFSTGNKGVPTDRQTDKQTDRQTEEQGISTSLDPISEFKKVNIILSQLDEVKKEIRKKFKSLTDQEMKVFSTIYTLENEGYDEITYKKISSFLSLSESSIRDYVNKILHKGVLIDKIKHHNKTVHLKISENIKSIASLNTILQLREL